MELVSEWDEIATSVTTYTATLLAEIAAVRAARNPEQLFEAMNDAERAWERLVKFVDGVE